MQFNSLTFGRCCSVFSLDSVRKSHTPTAETKADHHFLSLYLAVFSVLLSNDFTFCTGENAVRVESFGKSVDTHLFTNTKLPCWNALHKKWQTVWGCLFFSLPVTPSPYRQLHTHCMSISEEGLFHRDMALLYYLKVKSIELWFAVICLHVTHPHTGTSLKSHPHCSSTGVWQIIFIQNRTWWQCLRNKVEKMMDLEWVWA